MLKHKVSERWGLLATKAAAHQRVHGRMFQRKPFLLNLRKSRANVGLVGRWQLDARLGKLLVTTANRLQRRTLSLVQGTQPISKLNLNQMSCLSRRSDAW